jgi:hypothetical protein
MLISAAIIILASLLSVLQFFDYVSTALVISKGRGHEANPAVAWVIALASSSNRFLAWIGRNWYVVKLPIVGGIWYSALFGPVTPVLTFLAIGVALYSYVVWSNYKIAWRQA